MFERIKRLYGTRLDKTGLINAVAKGLITESQFCEICGERYTDATEKYVEVNPDE